MGRCGFCGGSSKCKMKKCKAYNIKCNTCNLFGHYSSCCTDFTKSRARKTRDVSAVSTVEVSGEESNIVRLSNVSQEKISRRTQGEGGDNRAATNRSRGDDVISEDVNNAKIEENEATNTHVIRINRVGSQQSAMSVVWCPKM